MAGSRQSLRLVPNDGFGALLRRQRLVDNLTQAELGERFGVRQQTIGAWERGERPQPRLLADLAAYVGLDDEQSLLDVLDQDRASRGGGHVADVALIDATDGEIMKSLAQAFLTARLAGSLSRDDHETFQAFIRYFQARQETS